MRWRPSDPRSSGASVAHTSVATEQRLLPSFHPERGWQRHAGIDYLELHHVTPLFVGPRDRILALTEFSVKTSLVANARGDTVGGSGRDPPRLHDPPDDRRTAP